MAISNKAQGTSAQSLSGKDYGAISLVMAAFGLLLLVLFALFTKLVPADVLNQFFYIVLVVWGLVSAVVLFGVMKSYARVTYKHVGGAVELGGPAAVAAIVVLGGLFVPRSDTFDLTIRPHGPGVPLITSGKIRIELGSLARAQEISANGEADFKGIPGKFRGASVNVLPQVDGYKEEYQEIILGQDALDLQLVKAPPPETVLKGRIVPPPSTGQVITVLITGEEGKEVPDHSGRFRFLVHKRPGETVRLSVCANGRRIFNDYEPLGQGEVEIHTRRPDRPCSE